MGRQSLIGCVSRRITGAAPRRSFRRVQGRGHEWECRDAALDLLLLLKPGIHSAYHNHQDAQALTRKPAPISACIVAVFEEEQINWQKMSVRTHGCQSYRLGRRAKRGINREASKAK